ncbi:Yippee family protein [Stagonosporopsis vannaccii]|nr:Yippee family protein [Stagonosporopsis vannaccii]
MAPSPTTPFPLYLLPRIPFRRRSSTYSTSTTSSNTSPSSSPPTPTSFLTPTPAANLRCTKCLAHLIPSSCIISKGFTGRHGRAYLVSPPPASALLYPPSTAATNAGDASPRTSSERADYSPSNLPNTLLHAPTSRQLVTGLHTVSDISCRACGSVLGWKYVAAEEETQRYKVGKYILETRRVVRGGEWEDGIEDDVEDAGGVDGGRPAGEGEEEIEFDSQDEDECEDLFSGVWSPELARRRRRGRAFRS